MALKKHSHGLGPTLGTIRGFSRRGFLAGLCSTFIFVNAAQATQQFTTWPFASTLGPSTRTMPNRISDIANVKEFGATGGGIIDDRAAIQAAFDAIATSFSSVNCGVIDFPPGTYLIGSPGIDLDVFGDNTNFIVRGSGNASVITGSYNGYLLTKLSTGSGNAQTIRVIRDLKLVNGNGTAGSGCIFVAGWQGANSVENCYLEGLNGLIVGDGTVMNVQNSKMSGLGGIAGCGIGIGGESTIYKCDVTGFFDAIRASGVSGAIIGCRCEINSNSAIALGIKPDNTPDSAQGWFVAGNSLEGNGNGMYFRGCTACSFKGNTIHGEDFNWSTSGCYIDDNCSGISVEDLQCYGDFAFLARISGSISGTTLTVSNVVVGTVAIGQQVLDANGAVTAGTVIVSGSGTSWQVNNSQTITTQALSMVSTSSTNPSVYAGLALEAVSFKNVKSYIATAGHGVPWSIQPTSGVQMQGTTQYRPVSQTFANKPTKPTDGDLWTFTDCAASVAAQDTLTGGNTGGVNATRWVARFAYDGISANSGVWKALILSP